MSRRFLLLILISSCFLSWSCVSVKKRPQRLWNDIVDQQKKFDVIIVPGVPFEDGNWSDIMRSRVLWSVWLYKKGVAKNIIYSGGAVYSPYYEAVIMGLYAQRLGVPKEKIFYEIMAEHSTENVFYSYEIARKEGFKSIALATDPFQSSMLKGFTRKRFGTFIQHVPIIYDSLPEVSYNLEIDPSPAFTDDFINLREREGFWKRLKGTFGSNIPWKNKNKKAEEL